MKFPGSLLHGRLVFPPLALTQSIILSNGTRHGCIDDPGLGDQGRSTTRSRQVSTLLSVVMAMTSSALAQITSIDGGTVITRASPDDPLSYSTTMLVIGFDGAGTLALSGGAQLNTSQFAAIAWGADGTVTLDGEGTLWTAAPLHHQIAVGYSSGIGSLTVANGADLVTDSLAVASSNSGATGTAIFDGAGTALLMTRSGTDNSLQVGTGTNTATVQIRNGAQVTAGVAIMGSSNSSITVTGAGSALHLEASTTESSNYLRISAGTFTVSQGATVTAANATIGPASFNGVPVTVSVDGAGSSWTLSGQLLFGRSSTTMADTIAITNGAALVTNAENVGTYGVRMAVTRQAAATVSGSDSSWTNTGLFDLGYNGVAAVTVAEGGTLSTGTLTLGTRQGSSATNSGHGTLNLLSGGSVMVGDGNGTVTLGQNAAASGAFNSTGTLNLGDGGAAGTLHAGLVTTGAGEGTVNFNHTDSASTFAPALSGSLSVNHLGAGTTTLTGDSTYTGPTTVSAGTLLVDGSLANSAITVADGAMLGGTGVIGSPSTTILSGGHLSPGNALGSAGSLAFTGNLTLNAGSFLDFQLGEISDHITFVANSLLAFPTDGTVTLNLSDAGGFSAGTYTLFDLSSIWSYDDFSLEAIAFGEVISGYDFHLSFDIGNRRLDLVATSSAIPEPSTYAALAGLATLGFAAWRRRSRRHAVPQRA